MYIKNCRGAMDAVEAACFVYPAAPPTPEYKKADITFHRGIYMDGCMTMDDGRSVTIWGFTDEQEMASSGEPMEYQFPSPAIRVTEGQIVHTVLHVEDGMWLHTIHHHGIEPSWQNDGVGHISWEVSGTYTYQWRAAHAGTYFYHCHTNTVLHAEMGMYGALIVDPLPDPNDAPETKRAFAGGPKYDIEVVWACDEIDPRWHTYDWAAGTCGGDKGFNNLQPKYFIISGVDGARSALTAPGVAVTMQLGQTLLARYICAGYFPQRITFGGLTATVVASDGRPLPTPVQMTSIDAGAAERYDCIIRPTRIGTYDVVVEHRHWITGQVVGRATTRITVT